jgi:hypothetical protein
MDIGRDVDSAQASSVLDVFFVLLAISQKQPAFVERSHRQTQGNATLVPLPRARTPNWILIHV